MTVKTLYRYARADGGVSVSPVEPQQKYTVLYRVIAEKGMSLARNGQVFGPVVDTEVQDGWSEVETPKEEEI